MNYIVITTDGGRPQFLTDENNIDFSWSYDKASVYDLLDARYWLKSWRLKQKYHIYDNIQQFKFYLAVIDIT